MDHIDTAGVTASWPEAGLFRLPSNDYPPPRAPPAVDISPMHPFNISENFFTAALNPMVPLTVSLVYAVTVKILNRYNRSRKLRPWAISKTRPFFLFVVLHNLFLALYSAWTFWGMLGGFRRTIISPTGPLGLAATADSFCRLHGPPGPGRSIFYNESTSQWSSLDVDAAIGQDGPSAYQMGRMWNEGLAYYGWIFYLSKFYEVLDTFIILSKGKQGSTLQTYHHAGAMLCMWAGMRYMSPPIWIFVLVNSFIHVAMYTYYTLTAFSVRIPMAIKRTLTSMQITQFLVGASYAMAHSFVTYVVPVTVTTVVTLTNPDEQPAGADDSNAPLGSLFSYIKRLVLGTSTDLAVTTSADAGAQLKQTLTETIYVAQPCIMTAGETFAIWLNVLYLAPLTYLFISFFVASYMRRSNAAQREGKILRRESNVAMAEKAGWDAALGLEREVYGFESREHVKANGVAQELDAGSRNGDAGNASAAERVGGNRTTRRKA